MGLRFNSTLQMDGQMKSSSPVACQQGPHPLSELLQPVKTQPDTLAWVNHVSFVIEMES